MSITARKIITKSLQKIGVLADGEVGMASQMNDGLDALNYMLQSWCARTLLTTAGIGESFPLVAMQNSYDIGPTYGTPPVVSDFTTSKPFSINVAVIFDASLNMYPVKIASVEEITAIANNLTVFGIPEKLVYDPGTTQQAGHVGTIYLFPTPDAAYTLGIESEKPFTELATLDTLVTFPPSYDRAIIYNLALELAPDYGRTVSGLVLETAAESMRIIETINSNSKRTTVDLGLPMASTGNILTG